MQINPIEISSQIVLGKVYDYDAYKYLAIPFKQCSSSANWTANKLLMTLYCAAEQSQKAVSGYFWL